MHIMRASYAQMTYLRYNVHVGVEREPAPNTYMSIEIRAVRNCQSHTPVPALLLHILYVYITAYINSAYN